MVLSQELFWASNDVSNLHDEEQEDAGEAEKGVSPLDGRDALEDLLGGLQDGRKLGRPLDLKAEQVLELADGDGDGGRWREAGDDGRRNEVDEKTWRRSFWWSSG